MGSFLQKLLTNPEDFKFYTDNQKGAVNPNNQNPRTIPFGRDRFNDGLGDGSNQPYGWKKKPGDIGIGVMIDDYANSYEDTIGEANIDDFIIRGGVLAPLKAVRDSIRLTRFFSDIKNPKGILFLAKQNLLSRIGTKTEASKGLGYAGGALNEGVYTPLSTIGQALVGFAGTHLNKQGLDPTGLFPGASINKYQEVISENQLIIPDDYINNRLINLIPKPLNTNPFQSTGILVSLLKGYSVNPPYDPSTLIEYGGGPGSVLGIGKTKIRFATTNDSFSKLTVFDKKNDINSFETYAFSPLTIDGTSPLAINLNRLVNLSKKEPITGDISYFPKFTFGKNQYESDILLEYKGGPGSKDKVDGTTKINYATEGFKSHPTDINRLFLLTKSTSSSDILLEYKGGPGSNGKVDGTTKIKYAINNEGFKLTVFDKNNSSNLLKAEGARYKTWNYSLINSQSLNLDGYINQDFRLPLINSISKNFLSFSPDYQTKNIEDNLNLGNPGRRDRNRLSYTAGSNGGEPLDKLNASYIYKSNVDNGYESKGIYSDIIPFIISILNNDSQVGGSYRKNMHFRAFIDSFSDSYDADWSSISYMGRAEKLYKYKGFGRKISMAFTVVAQSREEITAMYDKLNFLASSLAPEYLGSETSGYMAGNIAYITLGEYIYDQPGIINSLTFDIPEESPWEIGIDDTGERLDVKDVRQVPHMIKVTGFNFTPIHKFRPEKQTWSEQTPGTNSTELEVLGGQHYIDPLRPKSTNYDKEVQEDLSLTIPTTQQDILVT
jgi:hypothetical protein